MQAYTDRTDSRLIAYSLNDGLAIAYSDGRSPHLWAYAVDSQAYGLHLYPSLNKIWISDISISNIPTKGGCLQFGDLHLLFIMWPENAHFSCQPDVIIVDGDKVQSTDLSVLDVQYADVLVGNTQQFRQRTDWNNWMSHQACTCQMLDGKEKWVEYKL
jgi:hypothetical protein